MKTLAKLLLLTTLTLSSSAFAMKTIDLVDKAQMTDQQKMDLAQKLAEKQDWKAVFEIMYPLALEGNLQAQSNLGMLYNLGRGVDENKELAYWWFSEAAERGSIKAINNLAVMYFSNNYVKQDTAQAIKLFEASATKDPDAAMTLEIYTNQKEFTQSL
ncbi:MAG: tetratricopeptide repeat protein [Haemophilus parainfluenzae]